MQHVAPLQPRPPHLPQAALQGAAGAANAAAVAAAGVVQATGATAGAGTGAGGCFRPQGFTSVGRHREYQMPISTHREPAAQHVVPVQFLPPHLLHAPAQAMPWPWAGVGVVGGMGARVVATAATENVVGGTCTGVVRTVGVVATGAGGTTGPLLQDQLTWASPDVGPPLAFSTCSTVPLPVKDTASGDSKEFSSQAGAAMPRWTVTA
mmetsp:Transcript_49214/g.157389  ORF Transcript_49214/g.157389 Transcript_49214/m.157389 type:complete len:208 (-) Transcript_49214:1680-2303(-)